MHFETIRYDVADAVATIRLNRPDRLNAINATLADELLDAISRAAADEDVRAVRLASTGDRAFCAGNDLAATGNDRSLDPARVRRRNLEPESSHGARLFELPKPVIAAVNGVAVGGGLGLALVSDIIIASDTATFATAHIALAMPLLDTVGFLLPRRIGPGRAAEMAFTGRRLPASEALAIGLVDRVVPAADLEDASMDLARTIAAQAPLALRFTKQALRRFGGESLRDYLPFERYIFSVCFPSEDAKEAMRARRDKRPPQFQGR